MRRYIGAGVLFVLLFPGKQCCYAQESVSVPFLLFSPSAISSGMGETSVAVITSDPLASISNPAHLGMQSLSTSFSIGGNDGVEMPELQSDALFGTVAINKEFSLYTNPRNEVQLGLGLGYSRIMYRNVILSDPWGESVFEFQGHSDQITIGAGFDIGIRGSFGLSYKHIISQIGAYDTDLGRTVSNPGNAFDYGFIFEVPVVDVVSQIVREPITITPNLTPIFDLTFGFAKNNMGGGNIIYLDAAEGNPLPRYARVGIGINLGIVYTSGDNVYRPVSFEWSVEANDLLVRFIPPQYIATYDSQLNYWYDRITKEGYWENKPGIGDIDFMSNVFFGRANSDIMKKKGWELTIFELVNIRGGRVEGGRTLGYPSFDTWGYGIHLAPIFSWIDNLNPNRKKTVDSRSGSGHVEVNFEQSMYTSDNTRSWFSGMTFYSLNVILTR
jgi:hypothetical protein